MSRPLDPGHPYSRMLQRTYGPQPEECESCGGPLYRGICYDEDCLELRQREADERAEEFWRATEDFVTR